MVRIALMSDIHFGEFSRTEEFAVPGEASQDLTRHAMSLTKSTIELLIENKVEYVLIAGDLTSTGSPQEFTYCEKKILEIVDGANISRDNLVVGLGNHDIDWNISKLSDAYKNSTDNAVVKLVHQKYGAIAGSTALHSMDTLSKMDVLKEKGLVPFSGIYEKEHFIVFVLNSSLSCTHDQKIKKGKLTELQLEWFRESAKKYHKDNRIKIVLLHHHSQSYSFPIEEEDDSMLGEAGNFTEIAGEFGIDIIMHGHRHQPRAETMKKGQWDKPITYVCAGSLAVSSKFRWGGDVPNTIHILELGSPSDVIRLKNFEFTVQGWIPLASNRRIVPLDPIMHLGKVFSSIEQETAIRNKIGSYVPGDEIVWEELDDCLRCMSYQRLNEKFSELASGLYKIKDRFPNSIILVKS